ncbi:MAG: DUF2079 domain-containing protein [Methanospirillum sp.]|uniref:DUF2079 domain-containing protein n=1 Tax=Methanospirillum sp. TaxID=45200 RepID=UPI00236CF2EA|nr:DUF2079 domain-containing protein [Methanospirillum sp.]MDD1729273.1 DUF2079 domain-containing protein [Methanospirillum sp.]
MKRATSSSSIHHGFFRDRLGRSDLRCPDICDAIVAIGIAIYVLFFTYLSLFQYNTFQLEYDLAVFNQAFWNTVMNGELLTNSLTQSSQFGIHFSPILLTLVPVYALFPGPQTLLIAQCILLGLGAIPIYLCGKEMIGKEAGCLIGLAYLLYPSVHGVNLYDFHEVAFLPFLLGMTLWGFITRRRNVLLLFGLLSLFVKEDVSLILIMIGLIGLYQTRTNQDSERWPYLVLIVLSLCDLILFLSIIRPIFASSSVVVQSGFLPQYLDPVNTLSQHNGNRIMYVLMTFIPLLFTPLGAPEICAISIPSFLEILLSPNPYYYSILYQYSALVIPVLFFATIMTVFRVKSGDGRVGKKTWKALVCLILISTVISAVVYSPAIRVVHMTGTTDEKAMDDHRIFLNQILSVLPQGTSISTQYNLLPQVSSRKQIWVDYHDTADVILVDITFPRRAADFNDDIEKINETFVPVLNDDNLVLLVNKENPKLQSELITAFQKMPRAEYVS